MFQLTQKETQLLKDLKTQEQLCVEKYTKYSSEAKDPQLKNLFTGIAQSEQQHFETLCQIESGNPPQGGSSQGQSSQPEFTAVYGPEETPDKKNDCYLCSDLLTTEKHASQLYDTCIFEFTPEPLRNALNTIQKQEQNHGKTLYDYMSKNGMSA